MITTTLAKLDQTIGARFPRRLTRKQKESFLAVIQDELHTLGFETEQTAIRHWGISNRLLLTQCKNPKVVFMAHYDTPTIMPFGIAPFYVLFGHTRQVISSIFVFVLLIALFALQSWLSAAGFGLLASFLLLAISFLFVIPFFFPNPHNAEDNTSGVLSLLALSEQIKEQPYKNAVQFVFLDNEEWGLIGSQALKKRWLKTSHLKPDTIVINLDCVSRGSTPLVAYHKDDHLASQILPFLQRHLPKSIAINMKNTPLSDNYTFREMGAIDISYAEPSLVPGGYYIPRVHVPSDKDFSPEKTALLIASLTDFLQETFSDS